MRDCQSCSGTGYQLRARFSLIELSAESVVDVDGEEFTYNVEMSDVGLSIGDAMYTPATLNGTYVCLIKDGVQLEQNEFRYFYTISGNVSAKTISSTTSMVSGTQYTFPCTIPSAGGDEETVAAGDFIAYPTLPIMWLSFRVAPLLFLPD